MYIPMHIKVQAELEEILRKHLNLESEGQRITRWKVKNKKDVAEIRDALLKGLSVRSGTTATFTVLVIDR